MIGNVTPTQPVCCPKEAVTIDGIELPDYDFRECANQIFQVLDILHSCNVVRKMPFEYTEEVLDVIHELVEELDLKNAEYQQYEKKHIRVCYEEYLFAIEVFFGV